jgi:hypothetical protein
MYLQVHLKILSQQKLWIGRRANKWPYKTDPVSLCLSSEVEQQTQELANVGQGQINTSGVVDVMAREHAFTMENYMDAIAEKG